MKLNKTNDRNNRKNTILKTQKNLANTFTLLVNTIQKYYKFLKDSPLPKTGISPSDPDEVFQNIPKPRDLNLKNGR